jgi:hypothetical protein
MSDDMTFEQPGDLNQPKQYREPEPLTPERRAVLDQAKVELAAISRRLHEARIDHHLAVGTHAEGWARPMWHLHMAFELVKISGLRAEAKGFMNTAATAKALRVLMEYHPMVMDAVRRSLVRYMGAPEAPDSAPTAQPRPEDN